ncbi:cytochrome C oxidase subunit IV family protein [Hymenobacter sp. DG25A]|jgi:cytochrome c oxidase subunit IV|uniref:cytochrome C oxidase subunit IV family protein n=1 Tax=Hymenobacter sp. DG25A TaxID=1385663 RepID=UPI0006BD998E|nr:cytochrome C oxidase subunit IV family protein [Hymenobacter sp. DG25A]ALD20330.1 hypothetical protein AM218_02630 [Hymenobacter sp. DG25A]
MAHSAQDFDPSVEAHHAKPNTRPIFIALAWIVGITTLEFAIAFALPHTMATLKNSIFIVMTILKAFFIVGEFMHLKHETKGLIWTILIPMALLVWLLVALVTEGSYIGEVIFNR